METGKVKFFNVPKGYGFIIPDDGGAELFVHITGCTENIKEGDEVSYEETEGKKGTQASNVKLLVSV